MSTTSIEKRQQLGHGHCDGLKAVMVGRKSGGETMNLQNYLRRIDFTQPPKPDLNTLQRLLKAHLLSIPFENLDQQLGISVSNSLDRIYEKIVAQKRGGWCFELNALFAWLLNEIGFEVSMLAGRVGPDKPQKGETDDHMLLLVHCDGPFLVDAGFGGAPNEPVPLQPGTTSLPPYTITIKEKNDGFYTYSESAEGNEGTHWFTLNHVNANHFAKANHLLQTDPNSPFKRTLTAQRRLPNQHLILRGLVKKTIDETGTKTETLTNEKALIDCLLQDFNLDVPQITSLWPKLKQRHEDLFG